MLLLVVRKVAGNYLVDALTNNQVDEAPARQTWLIGTDLLSGIAWTAIIYGLIVMAAAILSGPTRAATWVRSRLVLGRCASGQAWSTPIVGLVYLLVVLWGPTQAFRNALWIIIFAGLIALGTEAFRRLIVREFPSGAARPWPSAAAMTGRFSSRLNRSIAQSGEPAADLPVPGRGDPSARPRLRATRPSIDKKDFPTFGIAVWWAIVTLATVGYGDVVPHGVGSRRRQRGDRARGDIPRVLDGDGDLVLRLGPAGGGQAKEREHRKHQEKNLAAALQRLEKRLARDREKRDSPTRQHRD